MGEFTAVGAGVNVTPFLGLLSCNARASQRSTPMHPTSLSIPVMAGKVVRLVKLAGCNVTLSLDLDERKEAKTDEGDV